MQPGQRRIIVEPSGNMRSMARQVLQGKLLIAAGAMFIMFLLLRIPVTVIDNLFGIQMDMTQNPAFLQTLHDMGMSDSDIQALDLTYKVSPISAVYTFIMTGPFLLGLKEMSLKLFRGGQIEYGDAFNGFNRFTKALGIFAWTSLLELGWLLLPIVVNLLVALFMPMLALLMIFTVPAGIVMMIMAMIAYSQSYYLVVDDPSLGAVAAVKISKTIMLGNKNKFLALVCSYLGWLILAGIANGIIMSIGSMLGSSWIIAAVFQAIGLLPIAAVYAYLYGGMAAYHELLVGNIQGQVVLETSKRSGERRQPFM